MMARPRPGIWHQVFINFVNSFKPKMSKPVLVGEDGLGNKYYESTPTAASQRTKPARSYLPAAGEEDFMQDLPSEWEAWLRGRRKLPPTPEEISANYEIMMMKKANAKALLEERKVRLAAQTLPSPEVSGPPPPGVFPSYGKEYELRPGVRPEKGDSEPK